MSIILSPENRKAASRRQLEIVNENATSTNSITSLQEQKDLATEADDVSILLYDDVDSKVDSYAEESRNMDGVDYSDILQTDIDDALSLAPDTAFFPNGQTFRAPKVIDNVNGEPTSIDETSEEFTLSNPDPLNPRLLEFIDLMITGQSGGFSTLTLAYSGGSVVTVTSTATFSAGKYVTINGGLLYIDSVASPTELNVTPVFADSGIIADIVDENLGAFSNAQRSSPGSDPLLNNFATSISDHIDNWEFKLNNQAVALNANEDSDNQVEIDNAISDVDNALNEISIWMALALSVQYTDAGIIPIQSEATARQSYIAPRRSEIDSALGSVAQNMDGSVTGSGLFKRRYDILALRIHRSYGTATKASVKDIGIQYLQEQIAGNNIAQNEYDALILTIAFALNGTNSNTITVLDSSGISISDSVYIISETQTEILATVTNVTPVSIQVDTTIPDTYTVLDKARIVKEL